jgi:hypothetical protein
VKRGRFECACVYAGLQEQEWVRDSETENKEWCRGKLLR